MPSRATQPPRGIVRRSSIPAPRWAGFRGPAPKHPGDADRRLAAAPLRLPDARPRPARARAHAPRHRGRRGRAPPLRALPPDAADGRDGARLRRRRGGAAGVRAVPPAAPRAAGPIRADARARPRALGHGAPRRRRLRRAVEPVTSEHHDRPAARGGLRLPRRRRQPPGVHRPLPQGLAAHPRGDRGPRRRRALSPGRALRPLRLLRPELRRDRAPVPDRRLRPRGQVQPDQDVPRVDARARVAAGARGWSTLRDRAAAGDRPARGGAERPPGLVQARRGQGAATAAEHPRGGPRPRRARDRRRA